MHTFAASCVLSEGAVHRAKQQRSTPETLQVKATIDLLTV